MAQSKTSLLSSGKKADRANVETSVLPRYNFGNGKGWCSKRERKKRAQSHTDGRTKAETCKAGKFMRYCATTSRARKHKQYNAFIELGRKHDQARR